MNFYAHKTWESLILNFAERALCTVFKNSHKHEIKNKKRFSNISVDKKKLEIVLTFFPLGHFLKKRRMFFYIFKVLRLRAHVHICISFVLIAC
jgi:hypothetical protein